MAASTPSAQTIKEAIRARFLSGEGVDLERLSEPERRIQVRAEVMALLKDHRAILPASAVTDVVNQVSDEVVGLGPIERLLKDPEVSEVMVNGADDVYVERRGRIERVDGLCFEGEEQVFHLIERIVAPLGLRVDESLPYVDARLPDGARVNAIIPPLSLRGPAVTIRKFTLRPFTPDDLVQFGTLNPSMAEFLAACVRAKANIVVSGGTASGKTTLLGVLSSFIPSDERLITIEDAAELRLSQPHVVPLEARPPNVEGSGEVTVRMLVRNALRMRPDRIIVGEVRGGEALDMLQAMNTGHEGSLSTAHANGPRDLLARLETMALMSDVDLPVSHVREQLSSALDLIVHMTRLNSGQRVISHISTVEGLHGGRVGIGDVFFWNPTDERFVTAGKRSRLLDRLKQRGREIDTAILAAFTSHEGGGADALDVPGSSVRSSGTRSIGHPRLRSLASSVSWLHSVERGDWPGSLRRLGSILE